MRVSAAGHVCGQLAEAARPRLPPGVWNRVPEPPESHRAIPPLPVGLSHRRASLSAPLEGGLRASV